MMGTPSLFLDADSCTVRRFSQVFCQIAKRAGALASDVEYNVADVLIGGFFIHIRHQGHSIRVALSVQVDST